MSIFSLVECEECGKKSQYYNVGFKGMKLCDKCYDRFLSESLAELEEILNELNDESKDTTSL